MAVGAWRSYEAIPVTLVKQYAYCPVIPWLAWNLGVEEPPTPSMETGRGGAELKERVARRLRLPEPWRFEVELVDWRLGLRGVVDIVAGERRLVVVEVKRYPRRPTLSRHFREQLMAYALLVSNTMGPVWEAVLVLGDRCYVYEVTYEDLEHARRMVEEAWRAVCSEEPPRPTPSEGMCSYCWYRRLCPYSLA